MKRKMSRVLIYTSEHGDKGDWFKVSELLETPEFQEFIKEKIKMATTLAKTKRGRQRTFSEGARLHDVYNFIHDCIEIMYKDVKINDPIIGETDIHQFLGKKYRVTIEELR